MRKHAKYIKTNRAVVSGNATSFTFDGPAMLTYAYLAYTSSATVGNRQLAFQMLNESSVVVLESRVGAVQAASATIGYLLPGGSERETTVVNLTLHVAWPSQSVFPAGYTFRVLDLNAVDASDSLILAYQYEELLET